MDQQVLAAMAKWPDVPAVYGWLALDGRGQWRLKGELLSQPAMTSFFGRNYQADAAGRWFVQNGPQRVYVALEAAPLVLRRHPGIWLAAPTGASAKASALFVTAGGEMYAAFAGVLALVDDRDLTGVLAECLPDWDGELATLPAELVCDGVAIALEPSCAADLQARFGVCMTPTADAG